jgi:hypothetical protein
VKRRRLLLILLGCAASITLAVFLWPREHEPEYKGVSLSAWLERGRRDPDFAPALKHMGTNALPFLIRAITYEEPRWRTRLRDATSNWPRWLAHNRFSNWLLGYTQLTYEAGTPIAFGILGPDADPALDELERIHKTSKNPATSTRALACIAFITNRIAIFPDRTDIGVKQ